MYMKCINFLCFVTFVLNNGCSYFTACKCLHTLGSHGWVTWSPARHVGWFQLLQHGLPPHVSCITMKAGMTSRTLIVTNAVVGYCCFFAKALGIPAVTGIAVNPTAAVRPHSVWGMLNVSRASRPCQSAHPSDLFVCAQKFLPHTNMITLGFKAPVQCLDGLLVFN